MINKRKPEYDDLLFQIGELTPRGIVEIPDGTQQLAVGRVISVKNGICYYENFNKPYNQDDLEQYARFHHNGDVPTACFIWHFENDDTYNRCLTWRNGAELSDEKEVN